MQLRAERWMADAGKSECASGSFLRGGPGQSPRSAIPTGAAVIVWVASVAVSVSGPISKPRRDELNESSILQNGHKIRDSCNSSLRPEGFETHSISCAMQTFIARQGDAEDNALHLSLI